MWSDFVRCRFVDQISGTGNALVPSIRRVPNLAPLSFLPFSLSSPRLMLAL